MAVNPPFIPIAVIGVGAIFPGSANATGFWRSIINGDDLITDVPASHWLSEDYYDPNPKAADKTYCKRGAFITPVAFDPIEYGIPPANLPQTDTTQLLALLVMKQVLTDAFGADFATTIDLKTACVILGVTSAQELVSYATARLQHPIWRQALRAEGIPQDIEERICQHISASYIPWSESTFPGLLGNVVSGRIANRFNCGGANFVTDAACASSLSALAMAISELQLHRADLAISGGADTLNDIFMFTCFSKTPALSPSGDCRPFDKNGDGTILGEGVGFFALKRLADAERDGNRIYAVIRGIGSSSDGRSKSVYAPVPAGQAVAIQRSYAAADFPTHTVELVEAHGTGTIAGDAAELQGLQLAFATHQPPAKPWCAVGSVKSQIGHTKAAAGAAALFKAVMALRHKVLPSTLKITAPNPNIALTNSPFYLNTQTRPWLRDNTHPRRAGVSSFGFGGANFHVALEEYQGPGTVAPRLRAFPSELVLLSATTPQQLATTTQQLCQQAESSTTLAFLAKHTQQQFRTDQPARLAIVASDTADLVTKLRAAHTALTHDQAPNTPDVYYSHGVNAGKIGVLFPGQGSQYVGMGADVLMAFDAAQTVWGELDAIRLEADTALHELVFPIPALTAEQTAQQTQQLAQTQWTQPALAATSVLYWTLLRRLGLRADSYAGHSFGELVALHAAGAFDQATLLRLARQRGELMQHASSTAPGAMTAVSYSDMNTLLTEIRTQQLAVTAANFNSPEQTVFSGAETAIAQFEHYLAQRHIAFRRLPVSAAFHSPLLQHAQQPLWDYLATLPFQSPQAPVYANVTAAPYPQDTTQVKTYLAQQLLNPVRFMEQIQAMYAAGTRTFIEVGAHNVLTQLVKRTLAGQPHCAIAIDQKQQHGITSLWRALAQLAVQGVALDYAPLWQEYAAPVPPETSEKPNFTVLISGTSYGKPYPPPGGINDVRAPNPVGTIPDWAKACVTSQDTDAQSTTILVTQAQTKTLSAQEPEQVTPMNDETKLNKILALYEKLQEDITKAHCEYQQLTEKSHLAYLEEARAALENIRMLAQGETAASESASGHVQVTTTSSTTPAMTPAAPVQHMAPPPPLAPAPAPVPTPVAVTPPPAPIAAAPAAPTVTSVDNTVTAIDPALQTQILAIVAEKTGYPQDTLSMDMDLEADLGIDSIKRVEILSTLQQQLPNLPALDPTELATLRTFREIAVYLKKQQGA